MRIKLYENTHVKLLEQWLLPNSMQYKYKMLFSVSWGHLEEFYLERQILPMVCFSWGIPNPERNTYELPITPRLYIPIHIIYGFRNMCSWFFFFLNKRSRSLKANVKGGGSCWWMHSNVLSEERGPKRCSEKTLKEEV